MGRATMLVDDPETIHPVAREDSYAKLAAWLELRGWLRAWTTGNSGVIQLAEKLAIRRSAIFLRELFQRERGS
jgi:hypothetical protein